MAINKISKNRTVMVKNDYNLIVGGKLTKIANQFNMEATTENLTLISNKKITSDGNKH
ncbi:hypothetical protein BC749_101150 [Flavobacterium araucananum]|jgi:hypothetical protein|uniref:hypothetical protein n=1 Tax=Flavobacterium araucananum TaxID=946678 RepID=UPI000D7AA259|nr:hypothetical protein [Flavobacterium araucananum]PWK02090.1 hypothetical protein BC749_101150 [Flavobacterium araucananum]